jgi:hypothetical protein
VISAAALRDPIKFLCECHPNLVHQGDEDLNREDFIVFKGKLAVNVLYEQPVLLV